MKRIIVIILAISLVLLLVACGGNSNENGAMDDMNDRVTVDSYNMDEEADMAMEPEMGGINPTFSESLSDGKATQGSLTNTSRKIIKSASMEIETLDYDTAVAKLNDKIAVIGGYIESSNVRGKSLEGKYDTRTAYYTIRIPQQYFEQFMTEMNTIGNIISENTYGEDITSSYFDTEARVKTLEVQEERLLSILEKAEKIEDIIDLERALSDVRYQIESMTGTLRRWDNLVSYATLNVNLYEVVEITKIVEPPKTLGDKISTAFEDSIKAVKRFLENSLIFSVGFVPFLLLIIPLAIIVWLIIRKVRKPYTYPVTPTKEESDNKDKS